MIAYTIHARKRIAFVEEVIRSWEATGHKLQTGNALFSSMVDAARHDVDEVHLIVRRDNAHARNLYDRIGCREAPWVLYEPRDNEIYMVASVADMTRRLAHARRTTMQWEVETGACAAQLREEDRAWAQQMYDEEHGGARKWAQHHTHTAAHILIWDGTGVGAAMGTTRRANVGTRQCRRGGGALRACAERGDRCG